MRTAAIALLMFLATAVTAAAQSLSAGDEIRLKSPTASGRFTVVRLGADALTLRDSAGAVVDVPLDAVERVDLFRGRRTPGQGFLRGAGRGFLVGAGLGLVLGFASGDDPPEYLFTFSAEEKALMVGTLLGGTGALLGGFVGGFAPGERWERVRLASPVVVGVGARGVRVQYVHRF